MTYYYKDTAGHEVGPVSEDEIHAFRAGGLLLDETLVRAADSADWISYAARFGRLPVARAGATVGTKFTRKQFFAIGLAAAVVAIIFCGSIFIKQEHTLSFALSLDGKDILPPKAPNVSVDGEHFSTGSRISAGRHLLVVQLEGANQIERQFWVIFGTKDLGTLALESSKDSLFVTATPLPTDAKHVANEQLQGDSERSAKFKEDEILRKKEFLENEFAKSWYADVDGAFAILENFRKATYDLSLNVNDTKASLTGSISGTPEQGSTQIVALIDRLRRSAVAQQLGWSQIDLSSLNKLPNGGGLTWEVHLARPDWKRKHEAVSWANEGIGNSGRLFSLSSNIAVMAQSQLTNDAGIMADRLIVPSQLASNLQRFYRLESDTGIHLDDIRQNQVDTATEVKPYTTVPYTMEAKGNYSAILNFMHGLENQHGWIVQIRNFSIKEIPTATPAPSATAKEIEGTSLAQGKQITELSPTADGFATSTYGLGIGADGRGAIVLNADYIRAGGWGDEYRALFRFDLHGLASDVEHAALLLTTIADEGNPASISVYRITEEWDPNNVRYWHDVPKDERFGTEVYTAQAGQTLSIDVTDLVRTWPNFGLALHPKSTAHEFLKFHSSRSAQINARPKLLLTMRQTEHSPGTPDVRDTPPKAGNRTDADILHAIANDLRPAGNFVIGGQQTLIFGQKRVKAGMPMIVNYQGTSYTLEMVAIDRTSFTLRLNREEVTHLIK